MEISSHTASITVSDGHDIITIGHGSVVDYFKVNKPVSLIWEDCHGSVGQYLCMLPMSQSERDLLQEKINLSLFEDFTGKAGELLELLKPLLQLFANGTYSITFDNGREKKLATVYSGTNSRTYEPEWYVAYLDPVNLENKKKVIEEHRKQYREPADIILYTTSWLYDWENTFYVATRPKFEIDADRVAHFEEQISSGARPFAILVDAVYSNGGYSSFFVLDGHHKLQAYKNLKIQPPIAHISKLFKSGEEAEFDIVELAKLLYPWQTKHIVDNWGDKDKQSAARMAYDLELPSFIKHGVHEEYHDNGMLKLKGKYFEGTPLETIREWYDNGNIKYERHYSNYKRVGDWKEWFSSGKLLSVIRYTNSGLEEGESVEYFEDGRVKSSGEFINGKPVGYHYSRFYHTKTINFEKWYEDGRLVRQKKYDDEGILLYEERYSEQEKKMIRLKYNSYSLPTAKPQAVRKREMSLAMQVLITAIIVALTFIVGHYHNKRLKNELQQQSKTQSG